MPRAAHLLTNFSSGELSPLMLGRVDLPKYLNGCETLENWLPLMYGGVKRRPGLRFALQSRYASRQAVLIPFEFSTTQAYMIEVGNLYMCFYRNGGIIINGTATINNCTNTGPGLIRVTCTGAHGFSTGDNVTISGVVGTYEANDRWDITVVSPTQFDLQGSLFVNAYISGGTVSKIVTVTTPYLEADLFQIKFAQNADTLYLVHPSYAPRKLTRTSHTAWTLSTVTFIDGPYRDENATAITITPSGFAAGAAITLTASAPFFDSGHVGALFRIKVGANPWGYVTVTGFTSNLVVDATVVTTLTAAAATLVWREGAWSTYRGFPSAISFFEQRLLFGKDQTISGSVNGSPEDMTEGTADDDAFIFTLGSNQVNVIRWLAALREMFIGTAGGEHLLTGGTDAPVTPTNVLVREQSARGSADIAPVKVGATVLFLQRGSRRIRELIFSIQEEGFKPNDVTLLSEHITEGGITQMAYQQEPDSIVYGVRADGELVALTYLKEQDVLAWSRHVTDGLFESVASIPNSTGNESWVIVKRTINSVVRRYVEYFDATLNTDCGLTYSGAAVGTVTGGTHLNGKTVDIKADGAVMPQQTMPASGSITLPDSLTATAIEIGLAYDSDLLTVRPELKTQEGTIQGVTKRWVGIFVRVFESAALTVNGKARSFRGRSDPMDAPPPELTGDMRKINLVDYDRNGRIRIQQTDPMSATVLGLYGVMDVGEH